MRITDFLDSRLIAFLSAETRDAALSELVALLGKERRLPDERAFHRAVIDREELVSTGIGMGVAIPHAKLRSLKDFSIAIGIQQKQGIDWQARDNAPVRLIFLIAGPDNRQNEYLQILSLLTHVIRHADFRKRLLNASTPLEVFELFLEEK
jgi:nitrogen PTS system EIIA component